jgi:hypothetical protein
MLSVSKKWDDNMMIPIDYFIIDTSNSNDTNNNGNNNNSNYKSSKNYKVFNSANETIITKESSIIIPQFTHTHIYIYILYIYLE